MTVNGWLQIAFYSIALLLVTKPLGIYIRSSRRRGALV